jgi:hypothetical protein
LAATFADGEAASAAKPEDAEEDVVLRIVKEHYANVFKADQSLMKSALLKQFKERRKGTGSETTLDKRFREEHFKPLLDAGKIAFQETIYIGAARVDGYVTLPEVVVEVA